MNQTIEPRHARSKTTRDLAFAAYAHMKGLSIMKATECRKGNANEYEFSFDDPSERWEDLYVGFTNSEALKFDNSVRSLKKLCKRNYVQHG